MKTFFSYFLLTISVILILFGFYLIYLRYSPRTLTFQAVPITARLKKQTVLPTEIIISAIHVNLPIIPAKIVHNSWETTTAGVSYWDASPTPGDRGNSVLYGHNWRSLLGSLPWVKPGNKIQIVLSNGLRKNFTVEYTAIVDPNQIDIINPTYDSRITIYTCTGFLDSKRFVVVARAI